jgi:CHASE2 domain-containing sensor protein/two-component sensor histidine kinase
MIGRGQKGRGGPSGLIREWWIVAVVATALAMLLVLDRTTLRLDTMFYDLVLRLDERPPDPAILLVSVDDESLARTGAWPWRRNLQAQLLAAVQKGRPRAIAYDVQLIERSPWDGALAAALAGPAPVFLPLAFEVPGHGGAPFDLLSPPAPIAGAAAGFGHVNLLPDADGIVRRVRLWDGNAAQPVPQLMTLVAARVRVGKDRAPPESAASFVARRFPLSGPTGNYPTISASAVLRGELPSELLEGRLVLIGATAQGLGDWHPTAARGSNGMMSGVELQANILDALLNDRLLAEAGTAWSLLLAVLAVWSMLIGFRMLKPRGTLLLLALLQCALVAVAAGALVWLRLWIPPVAGSVVLLGIYPLWGWRRLSAANSFMVDELERLDGEPDMLLPVSESAADPVGRPAVLLRNAITSLRVVQRQREHLIQFLSHDMRTPQASILAVLDTAKEGEISGALSDRIKSAARRTLELADNFVHLSRAEVKVYRLEPVDFADMLIDALDDLWPQLGRRRLTVDTEGEGEGLLVAADRALVTRAITNLIDNAIRFSPEGGRIRCRFARCVLGQDLSAVQLAISDDGHGVPPDQEAQLFERFERGAQGEEEEGKQGAGLGLAFVHAVAVRHQGSIAYERSEGAGATFILTLPLLSPETDAFPA